ncbi:MAG TPA: BatD family protein, partial [Bacteroidales bacterium]|nr:BatD family protein [Bacteroidales bacterium]HRT00238.1 BatD family protein [Bacteroidales bacterium]
TPEINITVKPLTSPPSTFTGAIGRFDFKIEKSADTVNVNDAITFKFIVFGTGNFNMIETPKLVWPKEFDVYDPVVNEKTSVTSNGVTGSKTWEYTLIPRFPGKYNLGKFNFTYYDLNTHQYKTIETKEVIFAVRRDKNDTKFDDKSYNYSQKGIEYIGDEDIRYIKTKNFNLYKTNNLITKTGVFPFLFIVPAVIFIVVIILLRKIIKERSNIVKLKQKNAGKVSRRRLKKAKKYLRSGENEKFYKEIIFTLWGFASDRLGIPVADLTKDKIINVLESLNADSQLSKNFIDLIDLCEFAHFAPVQTEQDKQEIYKKAAEIIEKLDQVL